MGECLWPDCSCEKFDFMYYKVKGRLVLKDNFNYDDDNKENKVYTKEYKYNQTRVLHMSDLNSEGKPYGF